MFSKGLDETIRDAMKRGEIGKLSGAGKRLDVSACFETSEELQLRFSGLMEGRKMKRSAR